MSLGELIWSHTLLVTYICLLAELNLQSTRDVVSGTLGSFALALLRSSSNSRIHIPDIAGLTSGLAVQVFPRLLGRLFVYIQNAKIR